MPRLRVAAIASALVLVTAALLAFAYLQSRPKPVLDRVMFVDIVGPPPTVAEMAARADAVFVGRYTPGARFVESERVSNAPTLPVTMHPFEVVDVLKTHPRLPLPGETFEVRLYGGQREHDTHIERILVPSQRSPVPAHRYVVFLQWHRWREVFELPWAFASIFDVTSGTVVSLYEYDRVHTGRPVDEFLSEVGLQDRVPQGR